MEIDTELAALDSPPYRRKFGHATFVFAVGSTLNLLLQTSGALVVLQFVYACMPMWSLANWISRNDPNNERVRVVVPFYRAAGGVRAAAEALALTFVYIVAYSGVAAQKPPDRAYHAVLALFAGIAVTTVLGLWGAVNGIWFRQRIWIDPNIDRKLIESDSQVTPQPYNTS